MTFTDFLWSNKVALVLGIIGVVLANIFLLYSVQRKGHDEKVLMELREERSNPKPVLLFTSITSLALVVILILWYLYQKH